MSRTELLETLEAIGDAGAVMFDDGRYVDFSGDGTIFEVGNADEGLNIEVTREELERIHAALTRYLLQTAE